MKKKVLRERSLEPTPVEKAIEEIIKEVEEEPIKVEEPKKRGRKSVKSSK